MADDWATCDGAEVVVSTGLVFGADHTEHAAEGPDVLGNQFQMTAAPIFYSEAEGRKHEADGEGIEPEGALDCPDDSLIRLSLETVWGVELLTGRVESLSVEVDGYLYPNLVELKETLDGHNDTIGVVLVPGNHLIDLAKSLMSLSPGAQGQELKDAWHVEPVIGINYIELEARRQRSSLILLIRWIPE